jgi:REP element-mobilizing transposase RayT
LPVHLILRADRSVFRKPDTFAQVNERVRKTAAKYGVRIYEYANVGNHLHLLIRVSKLNLWAAFIRELTGRIAQETGAKWISRPFTRLVRGWNRAYRIAKDYLVLNRLEGEGLLARGSIARVLDMSEVRPRALEEQRIYHSRS